MNGNGASRVIDWATMPDWIDVRQAAEKAGYHPDHLRRLIRHGTILSLIHISEPTRPY